MGNTVLNLSEYKMKCAEVESLASNFTDGELVEPVRAAIKRHSVDCLDCAELLSDFSQLTTWASNLGDLPISQAASQRLRERIQAEESFGI